MLFILTAASFPRADGRCYHRRASSPPPSRHHGCVLGRRSRSTNRDVSEVQHGGATHPVNHWKPRDGTLACRAGAILRGPHAPASMPIRPKLGDDSITAIRYRTKDPSEKRMKAVQVHRWRYHLRYLPRSDFRTDSAWADK